MKYEEILASDDDADVLAEIRLAAMRESLEAIGRFDPQRAKSRFLSTFESDDTMMIIIDGNIIGFYVLRKYSDHMLLDHLYITPGFQNKGIGSSIIQKIKIKIKHHHLPLRLGALKKSKSNDFYKNNGFMQTHQSEWDNYYEIQLK